MSGTGPRDGGDRPDGLSGRAHRTIAAVPATPRTGATFRAGTASLLRPSPPDRHVGVPVLRARPRQLAVPPPAAACASSRRSVRPLAALAPASARPAAAADAPTHRGPRPARRARPARLAGSPSTVHLRNDGPRGHRRAPARRRRRRARPGSATPVDLPTQSDKTYLLYAQPPSFGDQLEVVLVDGDAHDRDGQDDVHGPRGDPAGRRRRRRAARAGSSARSTCRRARTTSRRWSSARRRPTCPSGSRPGAPLDRLVWQDVDADRLDRAQLAALARLARRPAAGSSSPAGRPGRGCSAGVPRRAPALSPGRHDGRRRRRPRRARSASVPDGAADAAGAGRRAHRRPCARDGPATAVVAADATYGSGLGHAARVRPDGRLDRRVRRRASGSGDGSCRPARGGPSFVGRQPARVGAVATAAGPRPAADRWPDPAPVRLHRPDRPDQLPRPQAARPARVGVGHDAGADRRVRRRRLRLRRGPARQRRDRQRGRDRPRRAGRDRGQRPRSTSASSRRRAARTRCASRAARSCRRRSTATSSAARDRATLDVLQGDPRGPRPRRRLRVAADGPGRDRRSPCR